MIIAGCLAAGCQSIRVQSQYDHQVAFGDFHTFCWVPAPAWLHNDPRLHMDLVEPIVRRDVTAQLSGRGFREVGCATADFRVTFTAALQESFSERPATANSAIYEYIPGEGGEWFTSTSDTRVTYKRVPSLVIQMRRPGSDRVVWQGTASASLRRAVNQEQVGQRIQTAVRLILRQFPPPAHK
jgi:hypothetical protein